MKKLALTSLVAVFAASSAMAANHVSNPMYRPDAGMFYSYTSVASHTDETNVMFASEVLGYGITDRLAVEVGVLGAESDWFEQTALDELSLGLNWRVLSHDNWKMDLYGSYTVGGVWEKHDMFMDKNLTNYMWTAGLRGGYVTDDWTVAGHVAFKYANNESFNWDEKMVMDDGEEVSVHMLSAGVDGFLKLNRYWNLVAGVEYETFVGHGMWSDNTGVWTAKFGANLTLDDDKYIGAYIGKEMVHDEANEHAWKVEDGFAFGATFGIEF